MSEPTPVPEDAGGGSRTATVPSLETRAPETTAMRNGSHGSAAGGSRGSYGAGQPIVRTTTGVAEVRYRIGVLATRRFTAHLHAELDARAEHVEDFAFVRGDRRNGAGADLAIVWQP